MDPEAGARHPLVTTGGTGVLGDPNTFVVVGSGESVPYNGQSVRPTDQIDTVTNPGLVPSDRTFGTPGGPARPAFDRQASDFWAHGFNAGVVITF